MQGIPVSIGRIIRYIREKRLVDVEDPGVLPVVGDLDALGKRQRLEGHSVRIGCVPLAAHILFD